RGSGGERDRGSDIALAAVGSAIFGGVMRSFTLRSSSCSLALLTVLALTVSLLGCSSNETSANAAATVVAKPASETSAQPQPADYIASGPIVVENQIELAAQRDGVVAQVFVETGASVRKGQLLARLDDRQLTADRDAAAAKARSTEADLKNWESVAKEQAEKTQYQYDATEFEVERQREDVKYAQETLRSLELELEKTRITAPFDGVVARRYLRLG